MSTRLDIINAMLAVNGEAPVSSPDSNNPAAIQANNALLRLDKRLQSRGWWFNREVTELAVEVTTTNVLLPNNTLAVDPTDPKSPYVQRGNRLYDRKENTFEITEPVEVSILLRLDIDDCPVTYTSYLESKARHEYYTDDDGDAQKITELRRIMNEDYAFLHREDLRNKDVNTRNSTLGIMLRSQKNNRGRFGDVGP